MKKIIFGTLLVCLSVCVDSDPRIIAIKGVGSFEYAAEMIGIDFSVFNQSD